VTLGVLTPVVRVLEHGRRRVEAGHEHEAGRLGVRHEDREVGAVLPQHVLHVEHVARPRIGVPVARGLVDVAREHVVENDHARPRAVLLDVDEVAQRELEQVHPVDERELDLAAEPGRRVGLREVRVAGRALEADGPSKRHRDGERRVDPDAPRLRPVRGRILRWAR
jgi:hypothetical protein